MNLTRNFAAALIIVVAAANGAHAAEPPTRRIAQLQEWLHAVRSHEPGEPDAALYTLASWTNAQIRSLWLDVQSLMRFIHCVQCNAMSVAGLDGRTYPLRYTKSEITALREMADAIRERRDEDQILKRSAILHADVVMLANPEGEARIEPVPSNPRALNPFPPTPDRVVLKSTDGTQESLVNDAVHWDIAYALLGLVAKPQADATVRLWYRATIAHLQNNAMHDPAHFDHALRLFPDDPDIQFQHGCFHETLASAHVQALIRIARIPSNVALFVKSERAELEAAERFFRRALELDPHHQEARLRLGRVLGLLDRHEQAAAQLRQVTDDVDHLALRYYTALFLGREEEALGHGDAARGAYERAAKIFPLAQSPQLALSHLAREAGDRSAALKSAQRVLDLPVNEMDRRDPFWVYHFIEGRHVDALLDELYRPFRHTSK